VRNHLGVGGLLRQYLSRSSSRYRERYAYADCTPRFCLISKHPASHLQIVVTRRDHGHRNHCRSSRARPIHIRIHWTHPSLGISHNLNPGRKRAKKIQCSSTYSVVYSYLCFGNCRCCAFQAAIHPSRTSSLPIGDSQRHLDWCLIWERKYRRPRATVWASGIPSLGS
jgi:hypothetical protein